MYKVFLSFLIVIVVSGEYCRLFKSECKHTRCHHYEILQCNANDNVCQCWLPGKTCYTMEDEECAHACNFPNTVYRCDLGTCACSLPHDHISSSTDLLG